MSSINSLLESSASGWKNMQSDAARMASKWGKTGLLEGLNSEVEKNNMALILENQAKQLVVEQSSTNIGGANFVTGQGEQWAGVALPLVRKVFGSLSSKEFVSVQPMNLPSGLVFFLDFQYGDANGKVAPTGPFGPGGNPYGATSSMYGNTNPGTNLDPSQGLYGAGRFAYSINQFSASVTASVTAANWSDVEYNSDLSASLADYSKITMTVGAGTLAPRPDFKGVRAFVPASGSGTLSLGAIYDRLLPQYTTTNGSSTVVFIVSGSGANMTNLPTGSSTINTLFYNIQPVDNNRGDFEDNSGAGYPNADSTTADQLAIPQININMKSEAIVAKTRKLKAQWTPEFAQDLNAYQSLDAEAELTSIMSEYIALEIDLEVIDMLIQDASAADEWWSAKNNVALNINANPSNTGNPYENLGFFNTQGQWFQTLGTKMQKVSNKIHQKTLRGGANFIVTSPSVATILESIPGFASNSDGDVTKASYAFGIQKAGQMNSRYTVYKNPYMTEGLMLMGYRGSQFLETGAVFAPYVPLIMTPLVYDPDTFTPRKGLLTRYAKKMIRPEFFGRIYINDLNTL
jgi:hypothetical protein